MKRSFYYFYTRLSTIFLLLVLALGLGITAILFSSFRYLYDDVEQRLNSSYAKSIAEELQPIVREGFSEEAVGNAIHYLMVLNPKVEIYLLSESGRILAWFSDTNEVLVRDTVDLGPVKEFLSGRGKGLVLGEDPRNSARKKPFSAAELRTAQGTGFVYVILGGAQFDSMFDMIRENYLLRAMLASFLLAIAAALTVGFLLFFLLTRRLRSLSEAVGAFSRGEFSRRVPVRGRDEIDDLRRTFNDMAATIGEGVEKLRMTERLRRELIGDISHDLRSPLTSIQGYLETILIRGDRLSSEDRIRFVEICLRNTAQLRNLVDGLLELAQLEAGQVMPKREPLQTAELVQDVMLKLKPRAEKSGIVLHADLSPELPRVCADIGMIERVLTNLLENAVRYTPPGGSIEIGLKTGSGSVLVEIRDTGTGIREADLPRIFDRFYRSAEDRNRSDGGAGLGLAIAKQMVELHGSRLDVESVEGRGTTFRFSLPCPPC